MTFHSNATTITNDTATVISRLADPASHPQLIGVERNSSDRVVNAPTVRTTRGTTEDAKPARARAVRASGSRGRINACPLRSGASKRG